MALAVVTASSEEVNTSMDEDAPEEVGGEVVKVEEYMSEEVVGEAVAHMNMGFTSKMSPVTLKMHFGLYSQMIKEIG